MKNWKKVSCVVVALVLFVSCSVFGSSLISNDNCNSNSNSNCNNNSNSNCNTNVNTNINTNSSNATGGAGGIGYGGQGGTGGVATVGNVAGGNATGGVATIGDNTNTIGNITNTVGDSVSSVGDTTQNIGDINNTSAGGNVAGSGNADVDIRYSSVYRVPVQGGAIFMNRHLSQVPDNGLLWIQMGFNPELLVGEWNKKKCHDILKKTGVAFAEANCGFFGIDKAFDVVSGIHVDIKSTETLNLELSAPDSDYAFIGPVNVTSNKKNLTSYATLAFAVKSAMKDGADLVVLSVEGLNTIYHGESFNLGGVHVKASPRDSSSGASGIAIADTFQQGKAVVILSAYTKN